MSDHKAPRGPGLIRFAAAATILGLSVTLVHLLSPGPLVFMLFMTVGQGALLAGMGLFVAVIVMDLKSRRIL